jgi:hypothetical protein
LLLGKLPGDFRAFLLEEEKPLLRFTELAQFQIFFEKGAAAHGVRGGLDYLAR